MATSSGGPATSGGPVTWVRAILISFWLCRVSVLSVAGGIAILALAPQAQSVFFDLHTYEVGIRHWAVFYASVFLFWMLPTQLSTRVMLHAGEERIPEGHDAPYDFLVVHLPWIGALACLAGVGFGQYLALEHIPDQADELETVARSQVVTLLGVTGAVAAVWLLSWLLLSTLTHRLAVRIGLLDNRLFRFIATAMFGERATRGRADTGEAPQRRFTPQQLQSAWAAIVLFLIWVASLYFVFLSPLDISPMLSRAPMLPVLIGAWVPLLTFFVFFAHRWRLPILGLFILAATAMSNWVPGVHEMRVLAKNGPVAPPPETRQPSLEEALRWWRKANGCLEKLKEPCNVRPIIVAAEGGASRAAFFTGSLLAFLEDLSDPSKRGEPAGPPVFSKQLFAISSVSGSSLGAAVFAAMREDALGQAGWPRPKPETPENALWFKSGKAVGVGGVKVEPLPATASRKDVIQQVLAGDFLTPAIAALSLDLWVPLHAKFLNPGDRTYFLERSWEQRFADPSGGARSSTKSTFERPFSSLAPTESTWRPILVFNGTSVTTGRRIITSTLYPLMKSPDDDLEKTPDTERTIESVFRNSYDTYDLMCLPDTPSDRGPCTCLQRTGKSQLQTVRMKDCDVRLSTAVSNSARFPVVSSHGDIVAPGRGSVDRIVDGGYFDYSGIVTAFELQVQITRLDDALRPYVLFMTNDPGFDPLACQAEEGARKRTADELDVLRRPATPPTPPADNDLFSILRYPVEALVSVRVARSEQTMAQAVLLNRYENVKLGFRQAPNLLANLRSGGQQSYVNFDIVSVGARCNGQKQVRPIPMNWWLSMPIQDYLDQELCARHNRDTIAGLLAQLGPQPDKDASAEHAARYTKERQLVRDVCRSVSPTRGDRPDRSKQTR